MDFLRRVQTLLQQEKAVSEWVVRRAVRDEVQLYLIKNDVEAIRRVTSEEVAVEVHNDHPERGALEKAATGTLTRRGVASVRLMRGEQEDAADPIRQAAFMASLADNEVFHLPAAPVGGYPAVSVLDKNLAANSAAVAEEMASRLLAAVKDEAADGLSLSSAEFFLTKEDIEQANSAGASGAFAGTAIYVEMVLNVKGTGGAESERYVFLRRRRLADVDLAEWVHEEAARARDSVRAGRPRTGTVDLVVERDRVGELFGPILFHASGQAAYRKLARLAPGQPLWPEEKGGLGAKTAGDPLSLVSDGLLAFGTHTAPFDEQGLSAQRVPVVENSVVKNLLCTKQYADYLGIPATGGPANLVLSPGRTPAVELLAAGEGRPVLRVVDFSAFDPDPITGDFVAEIRLGYEGARPVKGGAVRGNVFEALAGARLASETGFYGHYAGPVAVRLSNLVVAGE